MDVTIVFTVALAGDATPHHAKPPTLRRTLPDAEAIPLTRAGTGFQARVSLSLIGASFVLKLTGQDYFDTEIGFSILPTSPLPTVLTLNDLVRRVSTRAGPVVAFEILAPQLREVAGPGAAFDPVQAVNRIEDDPLQAFPRPAKVGPGNGVAPPRARDSDDFLRPVDVAVEPSRLRFFEHRSGHPLIATYVPSRALPTAGDYIVYFKPPKHNAAPPKAVVEGYLSRNGATSLLAGIEQARSTAVMCFLIGEAGRPSEFLVSANGIASMVQEIDARLRAGNPFLVGRGVRSVALAGFSQGGEFLAKVLRNVTTSRLAGLLKAVFIFDCYFPAGEGKFKTDLRAWFNSASDLVIRSYWGFTVHPCDLYAGEHPGVPADDGAETRSVSFGHPAGVPDYMWVHFTDAFLKHHGRSLAARTDLHHAIPQLFLSHALRTAGMARSLV